MTLSKQDLPNLIGLSSEAKTLEPHLASIQEQGYTVIKGVFDADSCQQAIAAFKCWTAQNSDYAAQHLDAAGYHRRIVNLHLACDELANLFEQPLLNQIEDEFFQAETVLYTSLYFERGTQQDIHQDAPYFCTDPENLFLGVWIALEAADEQNGALEIIPKGHLMSDEIDREAIARRYYEDLAELKHVEIQIWDDYQQAVVNECARSGLVKQQLSVEQGDVIIWHPLAPHGGGLIQAIERTRHSVVMHVVPRGISVYGANLFFNPMAVVEPKAWEYRRLKQRLMIDQGQPHFQ